MSDLKLPKPYAADNYSKALDNLTKRYQKEGGEIHFSDVAFDGLSEDQARAALKFFGDTGLIEIPKQGHYTPPEDVVTWQRSIEGPAKQQAIMDVVEHLEDEYDVFYEARFRINNSTDEKSVAELSKEIGGKFGIDEDNLPKLERTIDIFAECGFFDVGSEGVVEVVRFDDKDDVGSVSRADEANPETEADGHGLTEESVSRTDEQPPKSGQKQKSANSKRTMREDSESVVLELSIDMDATEMDPDDLEKKLKIIEGVASDAGE